MVEPKKFSKPHWVLSIVVTGSLALLALSVATVYARLAYEVIRASWTVFGMWP